MRKHATQSRLIAGAVLSLATQLTVPALFVAGLGASLHCTLMCGAIQSAQLGSRDTVPLRTALLLVHAGRVIGYTALGALAGGFGAALMPLLPQENLGKSIQLLMALLLVAAGLLHLRSATQPIKACCRSPSPRFGSLPPRVRLLLQGLLWAALPCGILYGALLLATFSGSALYGGVLLAAFGLGTVPMLGASGGLLQHLAAARGSRTLRYVTAGLLLALGLAGFGTVLTHSAIILPWCADTT